jgi:hypothetical protein
VTAARAWLRVLLTIAGAVVMFVAEHPAMGLPIVASAAVLTLFAKFIGQ